MAGSAEAGEFQLPGLTYVLTLILSIRVGITTA